MMNGNIPSLSDFHLYTHAGCMDGSASAILFRHAGGKQQNIHWVPAGRVDEAFAKSSIVNDPNIPILIVDISPTPKFASFLVARGNVWIIDHHKTATFLNEMHPNFFVDEKNEACGSKNFRYWLIKKGYGDKIGGDAFRRFVDLVDDHDRWQLKKPFSLEMPKFFAFTGQKDFTERFFNIETRFTEEKDSYWTPFESDLMAMLTKIQEHRYRSAFEKMQIVDRHIFGRTVKVAYIIIDEVNNSEMLMLYLNEHPEIDMAAQISFGLQKVALRSNGKVDCSRLAQQYGGGGHANAAGHPLPKGLIQEILGVMHE
jgi:oligoribonuclease NrnB/cAMP/cGMP phosphodiesterase (DHH superfamily)